MDVYNYELKLTNQNIKTYPFFSLQFMKANSDKIFSFADIFFIFPSFSAQNEDLKSELIV